MEKEKIARINALAHKAKTSGLTEAELAERDALRQEAGRHPPQAAGAPLIPCSKWRPGWRGAVWFAQNCAGVLEFASRFAII